MTDTDAVKRVIALYSQLMDQGRFDEWGLLFAEDAEARSIGGTANAIDWTAKSRAEIVRITAEVINPMIAKGGVVHLACNEVVDLHGDTARAWWDVVVLTVHTTGTQSVRAGRYHSRFRRENGQWVFTHRTLVQTGAAVPDDVDPSPGR